MKPLIQNAERFGRDRLLPFLLRLLFPQKPFQKITDPKKILLVKTHHKIGDLLLGTPLIRNLKLHFPNAQIDFFAGEYCKSAIEHHPDLNRVYTFKKRPLPQNLFHDFATIFQLRKVQYDICFVVSASSFSVTNALVSRACSARITVGLEGPTPEQKKITHILYNFPVSLPKKLVPETELYLRSAAHYGVPLKTKDELMGHTKSDLQFAKDWVIGKRKNPKRPCIGIHPGGTYPEKQWGASNLIALIDWLKKKKWDVILFTGKNEEHYNKPILEAFPDLPLIPDVNFQRLAALQSFMDYFIANDTGTLHSACASGPQVLGIYMTTSSLQWAPLNRNLVIMERPTLKQVQSQLLKPHHKKGKRTA